MAGFFLTMTLVVGVAATHIAAIYIFRKDAKPENVALVFAVGLTSTIVISLSGAFIFAGVASPAAMSFAFFVGLLHFIVSYSIGRFVFKKLAERLRRHP